VEYKKQFNLSLQKFKELRTLGILKPIHNQLDKIITLLTGIEKPKVTESTSPAKNILDIESLDETKLSGQPNLFAKLNLKVLSPVKESEVKTESSFLFIKKEVKKNVLEELNLDFTVTDASSSKPQDILESAFDILREPVFPPATQRIVTQYNSDNKLTQSPFIQHNPLQLLSTESEKDKALDKYFDFVNEEL